MSGLESALWEIRREAREEAEKGEEGAEGKGLGAQGSPLHIVFKPKHDANPNSKALRDAKVLSEAAAKQQVSSTPNSDSHLRGLNG